MAKQTITEKLIQAEATINDQKDQIASQSETIAKLKKEVEQQKAYYKSEKDDNAKLRADIEQVHQILDTVPHPISRKSDHEESWQRVERSMTTRLAAWLCSRTI